MKFMALPPPPRSFIGGAKYLKKKLIFFTNELYLHTCWEKR